MEFDKFTERARGFIQSAQGLALRSGHQQFRPEHILKVLLDDDQGLASGFFECRKQDLTVFCVLPFEFRLVVSHSDETLIHSDRTPSLQHGSCVFGQSGRLSEFPEGFERQPWLEWLRPMEVLNGIDQTIYDPHRHWLGQQGFARLDDPRQ